MEKKVKDKFAASDRKIVGAYSRECRIADDMAKIKKVNKSRVY